MLHIDSLYYTILSDNMLQIFENFFHFYGRKKGCRTKQNINLHFQESGRIVQAHAHLRIRPHSTVCHLYMLRVDSIAL